MSYLGMGEYVFALRHVVAVKLAADNTATVHLTNGRSVTFEAPSDVVNEELMSDIKRAFGADDLDRRTPHQRRMAVQSAA